MEFLKQYFHIQSYLIVMALVPDFKMFIDKIW